MTAFTCRYPGDREHAIVSYLYGDEGDFDGADRLAFEAHLATCDQCRNEVAAFDQVRASLSEWAPPNLRSRPPITVGNLSPGFRAAPPVAPAPWWRTVPAWAQAAAALLCLAAAAGIANLDIRYDAEGLRVRTGWLSAPASGTASAPGALAVASGAAAPWRADLAAIEERLRSSLRDATAQAPAVTTADVDTLGPEELRRVRILVDESERRQQRELALRLAEAVRDMNAQRQADLVRIDRNIGLVQNTTGREMMRQRSEMLNYLTVRTASQRPQ